ncbi:MAG TPA: acyl-CoA dehydrogenase family protein, partial [Actinomycetota bacterium]|nr:acyl-CoA dehydrogenase family protein [Actinomycetota bacterium]
MDLSYTAEQIEFRGELRAWLASSVPHDLAPPDTREGFEQHRAWEHRLFEAGYAGLSWPSSYGGRDLDVVHQAIFEEEYLLADGPERVNVVGEKLMGRTLMKHGTDEQRARWLPRILTAEDVWSQGFSEPDAGSDLANVQTRAVRDGDDWVIDGQKIWTSYGASADWIFVLVRTDLGAERHRGLSFVAVEMTSRGVEARPIAQLDGHAGFAEVFFTGVRAPVFHTIGEVNDGWSVALSTLGFERDAPARPAARYQRDLRELVAIARARNVWDDPTVRDAMGALAARVETYKLHTLRTLTRLQRGESIGNDASLTKLLWSELERDIFEYGMQLLGPYAGALDGSPAAASFDNRYWYARAATIYAGTSEIQNNIVAERILG